MLLRGNLEVNWPCLLRDLWILHAIGGLGIGKDYP